MKTYNEIQEYFDSLTIEQLKEYHNELITIQNPNDFIIVKEVVDYCFGKIDIIHLQINKLHWHFVESLINKI